MFLSMNKAMYNHGCDKRNVNLVQMHKVSDKENDNHVQNQRVSDK